MAVKESMTTVAPLPRTFCAPGYKTVRNIIRVPDYREFKHRMEGTGQFCHFVDRSDFSLTQSAAMAIRLLVRSAVLKACPPTCFETSWLSQDSSCIGPTGVFFL